MSQFVFEGTARWKGELESDVVVKDKHVATISPPPEFGGKEGYLVPEEIFSASLASCMNTLFLLIAKNSKLELRNLETKTILEMTVEGMEKMLFTNMHFKISVGLKKDTDWERKKANSCFKITQKTCPLRQSWGEKVPITFELNFQ